MVGIVVTHNKLVIYDVAYVIIAEGYLKQRHPGRRIGVIEGRLYARESLVEEIKRLGKSEEHDHVDDTKG